MKFSIFIDQVLRHLQKLHPKGDWSHEKRKWMDEPCVAFLSGPLHGEIVISCPRVLEFEETDDLITFSDFIGRYSRMVVHSFVPKNVKGETIYYNRALPTANISLKKSFGAIAREIFKRVVTPYVEVLQEELLPRLKIINKGHKKTEDTLREICNTLRIPISSIKDGKVDLKQKGYKRMFPYESSIKVGRLGVHFELDMPIGFALELVRRMRAMRDWTRVAPGFCLLKPTKEED